MYFGHILTSFFIYFTSCGSLDLWLFFIEVAGVEKGGDFALSSLLQISVTHDKNT
jgi:hypothetical protein